MTTPRPPLDLASRQPEILVLEKGALIERFFRADLDPIFFDKGLEGRLNAPDGGYGVLYAAAEIRGAFAETFLREPGQTQLAMDMVGRMARAQLRVTRRLQLIKLMGSGLVRLGATAEVTHRGLPYDIPQEWSKALRSHPAQADGIVYRARHDDDVVCYALFDHRPICVVEALRQTSLDERDWFWEMMDLYGVGTAPR